MPFPSPMKAATEEAMQKPRIGDQFTEMFAFWMYIIDVKDNVITTIECAAPAILPDDGKVVIQTMEQFLERFAYKGIPGFWISLVDRDNDVSGWLENSAEINNKVPSYSPGIGSWSLEMIEDDYNN